jgi:O-acetyl-ADP-ribose deacetylase (regulator of RNase III)
MLRKRTNARELRWSRPHRPTAPANDFGERPSVSKTNRRRKPATSAESPRSQTARTTTKREEPMSRLDQLLNDLSYLINWLSDERKAGATRVQPAATPQEFMEQWDQFRALVNTREPIIAPEEFLTVQDRVLKLMVAEKGIVSAADFPRTTGDGRISIWKGDICAIECDGIVNAANSALLGCWIPGHECIDNAIHTFAGVQLRLECAFIMREQGYEEPVGRAKVTRAYNLPAKHVIHTVGPMCKEAPTVDQRKQLAQCYVSCLDAAAEAGMKSVAFCCISTGVFGFPQAEGARIAVQAVQGWLDAHEAETTAAAGGAGETTAAAGGGTASAQPMHVIFDVFTDDDLRYYQELLGQDDPETGNPEKLEII